MGLECVSVGGLRKSPGVAMLKKNASRTNCNLLCPLTLESDQGHVGTTVDYSVSVVAVASPNRVQHHRGWKCIIKVVIKAGRRRREAVVAQACERSRVHKYSYPQSLSKGNWTVSGRLKPLHFLRSSSTSYILIKKKATLTFTGRKAKQDEWSPLNIILFPAGFFVAPRTCDSVVQSVVMMMAAGNVHGKEGESHSEHLQNRIV